MDLETPIEKYGFELSAASSITGLYAAQYSAEAHRTKRVSVLLQECYTSLRQIQKMMPMRSMFASVERENFTSAGRMIYVAIQSLDAVLTQHDTIKAEPQVNREKTHIAERT